MVVQYQDCVTEALRVLGIESLVLGIHDAALPCEPTEDLGYGTPYGDGARALFEYVRSLGFTGVQLGPQGETSHTNPSPYDGTAFSKNPLLVSLSWLASQGLIADPEMRELTERAHADQRERVNYRAAWEASHRALDVAFHRAETYLPRLEDFAQRHSHWIEPMVLFAVLRDHYGEWNPERWPDSIDRNLYSPGPGQDSHALSRRAALVAQHSETYRRRVFAQWCLAEQHQALRRQCKSLGLRLYGDLHVGLSMQDLWRWRRVFLRDYVMGAPPSRTTPEGQPWGYPVIDPAEREGAGRDFLRARFESLFAGFDGLRIDHPHGLVCPWVYRADTDDEFGAVRSGARLFESPKLEDHPALARYALVTEDQLDLTKERYADERVRTLSSEQIERFAWAFELLVATARSKNRAVRDLVCEVLSTRPRPLAAVVARYGLGRFCVTQKANPRDRADNYRSENAREEDWIMAGNHDTRSLWAVSAERLDKGTAGFYAAQLAGVLANGDNAKRVRWEQALTHDHGLLAHAGFAELFTSRARNVFIYFTDFYGLRERYNTPGTVGEHNWSLRLTADNRTRHLAAMRNGAGFDLAWALAVALTRTGRNSALVARLRAFAVSPHPIEP